MLALLYVSTPPSPSPSLFLGAAASVRSKTYVDWKVATGAPSSSPVRCVGSYEAGRRAQALISPPRKTKQPKPISNGHIRHLSPGKSLENRNRFFSLLQRGTRSSQTARGEATETGDLDPEEGTGSGCGPTRSSPPTEKGVSGLQRTRGTNSAAGLTREREGNGARDVEGPGGAGEHRSSCERAQGEAW